MLDLNTKAKNTWCPGCPNFGILASFKAAIAEMAETGELSPEKVVIGAGIGCHGKITDYLNLNSFAGLHGRIVPLATGIKLANPDLKVIAFSGDGDSYAEGLDHVIHAARRNSDITLIVHNNQTFALTTGQATPTSPKGFKGKTTPFGNVEEPLNSLDLLLTAGAGFVARGYALEIAKTKELIKEAVRHKGFSLLEIIQPCITFNDTREFYKNKIYWIDAKYQPNNFEAACKKLRETNKTPLGIFYRQVKPVFEELI